MLIGLNWQTPAGSALVRHSICFSRPTRFPTEVADDAQKRIPDGLAATSSGARLNELISGEPARDYGTSTAGFPV
jgi:hypothetical protein